MKRKLKLHGKKAGWGSPLGNGKSSWTISAKRAVEGVVRTQKGETDGSKSLFQECLERGMSAVNYALH